ncbi:unnamed protein product [Coregonus sp. 'balchen']|nr:unnamed protein product [Coregonus sp. 'balchen']
MAYLQNADPALREYILKHSLPQIFQALLTGLCVSCPERPLHFLERKIVSIQENRDTVEIEWAWKRFIWNKRKEARELTLKMETAERHYIQRGRRVALCKWVEWVQVRKRRQNDAMKKIQRVWNAIHCKIVIAAWRYVVQDSKRTKEYFEVFQSLDVGDLLKCAEVCRTWKAITQTCSLWSRISFSVERDWITDSIVEQILQKYRPFVVHLNMRGCTSLQWPSFKCISEY